MIEKAKNFIKANKAVLIVLLIYLIFALTSIVDLIGFVPDYLHLSKLNSQDYFSLMIGAIASIFGIIMAVVIIAIEFSKEKLNNIANNPLNNELIRKSLTYSITLIAITFTAYIHIRTFETSKNVTLGYYLGFLFLVYLYSIYPIMKELIGRSSRIKENFDLLNEIDINTFKEIKEYRFRNKSLQNNTLITLKQEIDGYILNNNVSTYEIINTKLIDRIFNFISNGQDRQQCDLIFDNLSWLWGENIKTAIRVNDSNYFEMIIV